MIPDDLTIAKAHEGLTGGSFTARDLAEHFLKKSEAQNGEINAYVEIYDDVLAQADVADQKIKEGKAGVLTGIPLAIKDNILIDGRIASAGSKMLENYHATYDATVIKKLKNDGAVFLGRTNMDEFAMGGSNETSFYGPVKNPHDIRRVPGGSSGGSAAAVAMNGALAALGSDTGGSIRQPAALCGVVGFKPTYGTVSRFGLIAMASSLDQIGPITRTVEDAEMVFNAIKGKDTLDSTTIEVEEKISPEKKVIGVPRSFLAKGVDEDVLDNFNDSLAKLEKEGYTIKDVEMPYLEYSLPAYYIIMPAEASSNLARLDGVKYGFHKNGVNLLEDYKLTRGEGFGKEVRRRIMLGTYVLSAGYYDAYYNKALQVRTLIRQDFDNAYKDVDCIAMPTSPTPAFKIGEKTSDPVSMYLADIFTVSANLAGVPALSLPSGVAEKEGKNLPIGFQFIAPRFAEDALFKIGKIAERVFWSK